MTNKYLEKVAEKVTTNAVKPTPGVVAKAMGRSYLEAAGGAIAGAVGGTIAHRALKIRGNVLARAAMNTGTVLGAFHGASKSLDNSAKKQQAK